MTDLSARELIDRIVRSLNETAERLASLSRDAKETRRATMAPAYNAANRVKTMTTLTAYIEFDPETELYVGVVPGLPGAHTQAATLDELRANLKEVTELVLEADAGLRDRLPRFVGVQQIDVA